MTLSARWAAAAGLLTLAAAGCGGGGDPATSPADGSTGSTGSTATIAAIPAETTSASSVAPGPTTLPSHPLDGLPRYPTPEYPAPLTVVSSRFAAHEATPFCATFRSSPPPGDATLPTLVTECRDMTSLPQRASRIESRIGDDPALRTHDIVSGTAGEGADEHWFCATARPGDTVRSCDIERTGVETLAPRHFGLTVDRAGRLSGTAPPGMAGVAATAVGDGSTTVAGRPASCWILDAGAAGELRQCVDDLLGLLVLVEHRAPLSGESAVLWELLEIRVPDAADFEPSGDLVEGIFFSEI